MSDEKDREPMSRMAICKTCKRDRLKFCDHCEDQRDRALFALSEFASSFLAFVVASGNDQITIEKFGEICTRMKRAQDFVLDVELARHLMQKRDMEAAQKVKDSTQ